MGVKGEKCNRIGRKKEVAGEVSVSTNKFFFLYAQRKDALETAYKKGEKNIPISLSHNWCH